MAFILHILSISIVTFALSLAPSFATVNTEKIRNTSDKEGYSGFVDGSLTLTGGNTQTLNLAAGLRLQHETFYAASETEPLPRTKDLKFLAGNVQKSENRQGIFINNGFAHLRWTHMFPAHIGIEAFTQYQFNAFQRLILRQLAGAGARYVLFHQKQSQGFLGSGYMFEIEKFNVKTGAADDAVVTYHRWNNYLSLHTNLIEDTVTAINTFYYQPRFDELSDYRFLEEAELRFKIYSHLSFGVSFIYTYQSRPPTDVKPQDFTLANSVRAEF